MKVFLDEFFFFFAIWMKVYLTFLVNTIFGIFCWPKSKDMHNNQKNTKNIKRRVWKLRSLFLVIGLLHIIGLCSRASVMRSSALCSTHLSVLCSGSWSCLGHPQPPWRTRHGCTVGVNRDPPVCSRCPGSMASVAERQPYVR